MSTARSALMRTMSLRPARDRMDLVSRWLPGLVVVTSIAVFGLQRPGIFFSTGNLGDLLVSVSVLGVLAMGLTVTLQSGEFDLAFPQVIVLSGVVAGLLLASMSSVPAILIAVLAGSGVGLFSGVLVAYLRVNSFVGTLGVSTMVIGVLLLLNDGRAVSVAKEGLLGFLGRNELLGISALFWIFAAIAAVVYAMARRTAVGRKIEASGASPSAAALVGINTRRMKVLALVLMGTLAALAGLMLTARLGGISPEVGPPFLFQVYTVVFLGAVMDPYGRFSISGSLFGLLAIAVLNNGLTITGVNVLTQSVATGGLLLAAVLLARSRVQKAPPV